MKKILLGFILLFSIVTITLVSCKKTAVEKQTISSTSSNDLDKVALDKLKTTTTTFIAKEHSLPHAKNIWSTIKTILRDIAGTILGGISGLTSGSSDPLQSMTQGAAQGGSAASAAAIVINNGNSNNSEIRNIAFSYSNVTANSDNSRDNIGYWHYKCLNDALASTSNYMSGSSFSVPNYYSFSSNELTTNSVCTSYIVSSDAVQSIVDYVMSNNNINESGKEMIDALYSDSKINSTVHSYLSTYFDAFDSATSMSDFISYSISAENTISASSLCSNNKNMILAAMATARYSVQYYSMQ